MTDEQKGPRRSRMRSCLIVILAVLLVLGCAYCGYRLYLWARVRSELNAIRAAGYPATAVELDEWYEEPPPGENAAEVFEQAFSRYFYASDELQDRTPFWTDELPPRGKPLPEDMREAIDVFTEKNGEAIALLHRAAAMERCRYPVDLKEGFFAFFPATIDTLGYGVKILRMAGI